MMFWKKITFIVVLLSSCLIFAQETDIPEPIVVEQLLEEARANENWKTAFVTAEHAQIVFMNVSRDTNPRNEIGKEVHSFDQVILIVSGRGKAVLNGKIFGVKEGDMIFIPENTEHNVINLGQNNSLKLISFYSENDIPKGATYERKIDEPSSHSQLH